MTIITDEFDHTIILRAESNRLGFNSVKAVPSEHLPLLKFSSIGLGYLEGTRLNP